MVYDTRKEQNEGQGKIQLLRLTANKNRKKDGHVHSRNDFRKLMSKRQFSRNNFGSLTSNGQFIVETTVEVYCPKERKFKVETTERN